MATEKKINIALETGPELMNGKRKINSLECHTASSVGRSKHGDKSAPNDSSAVYTAIFFLSKAVRARTTLHRRHRKISISHFWSGKSCETPLSILFDTICARIHYRQRRKNIYLPVLCFRNLSDIFLELFSFLGRAVHVLGRTTSIPSQNLVFKSVDDLSNIDGEQRIEIKRVYSDEVLPESLSLEEKGLVAVESSVFQIDNSKEGYWYGDLGPENELNEVCDLIELVQENKGKMTLMDIFTADEDEKSQSDVQVKTTDSLYSKESEGGLFLKENNETPSSSHFSDQMEYGSTEAIDKLHQKNERKMTKIDVSVAAESDNKTNLCDAIVKAKEPLYFKKGEDQKYCKEKSAWSSNQPLHTDIGYTAALPIPGKGDGQNIENENCKKSNHELLESSILKGEEYANADTYHTMERITKCDAQERPSSTEILSNFDKSKIETTSCDTNADKNTKLVVPQDINPQKEETNVWAVCKQEKYDDELDMSIIDTSEGCAGSIQVEVSTGKGNDRNHSLTSLMMNSTSDGTTELKQERTSLSNQVEDRICNFALISPIISHSHSMKSKAKKNEEQGNVSNVLKQKKSFNTPVILEKCNDTDTNLSTSSVKDIIMFEISKSNSLSQSLENKSLPSSLKFDDDKLDVTNNKEAIKNCSLDISLPSSLKMDQTENSLRKLESQNERDAKESISFDVLKHEVSSKRTVLSEKYIYNDTDKNNDDCQPVKNGLISSLKGGNNKSDPEVNSGPTNISPLSYSTSSQRGHLHTYLKTIKDHKNMGKKKCDKRQQQRLTLSHNKAKEGTNSDTSVKTCHMRSVLHSTARSSIDKSPNLPKSIITPGNVSDNLCRAQNKKFELKTKIQTFSDMQKKNHDIRSRRKTNNESLNPLKRLICSDL